MKDFKKINFNEKKISYKEFLIFVIAVIFIFLGYIYGEYRSERSHQLKHKSHAKDYVDHSSDSLNDVSQISVYTNPLLQCGDIKRFSNKFVYDTKDEVNNFIFKQKTNNPSVKYVSVYFRDLNGGPIFGINEQDEFIPGSLLKLPLMMAVLKKTQSEPDFLSKQVKYDTEDDDYKPYYKPRKTIEFGKTYTVSELLNNMIIYSDNDATSLLSNLLTDKEFNSAYEELGIDIPKKSNFSLTVQTYASFFRILYNASYINPVMSGKALRMLADTDFEDGLSSGVPYNISVSHKFGERTGFGLNQLHDCGIIYYPDHPYILCVMTRGENFPDLAQTIKGISKTVYDRVNDVYKE